MNEPPAAVNNELQARGPRTPPPPYNGSAQSFGPQAASASRDSASADRHDWFARLRERASEVNDLREAEQQSRKRVAANADARHFIRMIGRDVYKTSAYPRDVEFIGHNNVRLGYVKIFEYCDAVVTALNSSRQWQEMSPGMRVNLAQACWNHAFKRLPQYLESVYVQSSSNRPMRDTSETYVPYVLSRIYALHHQLVKLSSNTDEPREAAPWQPNTAQVMQSILPSCYVASEYGELKMLDALEQAVDIIVGGDPEAMRTHCGSDLDRL